MNPILSDLEKEDLAWATEEEDFLNIEELDLAFLLSLECFDPSKPIDKQEEEKLGDSWDNYGFEDTELQSPLDGLKSPRPSPKWNYLGRVDGGHGNFQGSKSDVARLRKAQMKTNKSGRGEGDPLY